MKVAVSHVLDPAVKNSAVALGVPGRAGPWDATVSPDRYGRPHAGLSRGAPRLGSATLKNPRVVGRSPWIVHTSTARRWMARTTP